MKFLILHIVCIVLFGTACSGFLDVKPNQKMAIPKSLEHCDLLLNDYSVMNTGYPSLGEIASDDYYISTKDWKSISVYDEQQTYIWAVDLMTLNTQWQNPYKTVYLSNQILDILDTLDPEKEADKYNKVLGAAHFFRAFAFHQVTSVFTVPYQEGTAKQELGIPLRLSPAMDYKSVRSTLSETYEQIIKDYKVAIQFLPFIETLKGRPHKAAAYAALARVYLDVGDYHKSYAYSDSSLMLNRELLNFQELNASAALPIARFNKEVLFSAVGLLSGPLGQVFARVDSVLYNSYCDCDFRKAVYFKHNTNDLGTYAFKGSFDNSTAQPFVGLTVGEVYLIRAETAARIGEIAKALADVNTLLKKRIDADYFIPITETDPDKLLREILTERRKELIFRGQRWSDLKRLNQDDRFKKTLVRVIDGKEYRLEPNSLKYAHLIPNLVISESGIPQNKR